MITISEDVSGRLIIRNLDDGSALTLPGDGAELLATLADMLVDELNGRQNEVDYVLEDYARDGHADAGDFVFGRGIETIQPVGDVL